MSNLAALKEQADALGITYGKTISEAGLQQRINEHLNTTPESTAQKQVLAVSPEETMRTNAMSLIRCVITPMDKAKTNYEGELFEAGNSALNVRKFVPFGVVTHIEKILFDFIKSKTLNTYYDERGASGRKVRKCRQIKGYAIEVLPQLTKDEIAELAKAQQARQSIE